VIVWAVLPCVRATIASRRWGLGCREMNGGGVPAECGACPACYRASRGLCIILSFCISQSSASNRDCLRTVIIRRRGVARGKGTGFFYGLSCLSLKVEKLQSSSFEILRTHLHCLRPHAPMLQVNYRESFPV